MPNDLFVPPGHYYSPIPGDDEIQRYWKYREQPLPQTIASIDFNAREQDENLSGMISEYRTLPSFPANRDGQLRYYYLNPEWPTRMQSHFGTSCASNHWKPTRAAHVRRWRICCFESSRNL